MRRSANDLAVMLAEVRASIHLFVCQLCNFHFVGVLCIMLMYRHFFLISFVVLHSFYFNKIYLHILGGKMKKDRVISWALGSHQFVGMITDSLNRKIESG